MFWCFASWQVAQCTWIERKIAATLFGEPPSATVQDALLNFLKVRPFSQSSAPQKQTSPKFWLVCRPDLQSASGAHALYTLAIQAHAHVVPVHLKLKHSKHPVLHHCYVLSLDAVSDEGVVSSYCSVKVLFCHNLFALHCLIRILKNFLWCSGIWTENKVEAACSRTVAKNYEVSWQDHLFKCSVYCVGQISHSYVSQSHIC